MTEEKKITGCLVEVQQLRQYNPGGKAAGGMSGLPAEVRVPECDLLSAGLRFHWSRSPAEVIRRMSGWTGRDRHGSMKS